MSRSSALALVATLALAACGRHAVPVDLKRCDVVTGSTIAIAVHNGSRKPVGSVDVEVDFYDDFVFHRVRGTALFLPPIAPNADGRNVLGVADPKSIAGKMQHCTVVGATYADGSRDTADAPALPGT